jgi:Mg/Co/Ni transporter MgtE
MSPRAASRLETLGFRHVYDYAAGKADWFSAGLPMEGEVANAVFIGRLVRADVPNCRLEDRVADVGARAAATGWDQAVVLDERDVLLGWLSRDALRSDPAAQVSAVMLEGPVTFRPNTRPDEAVSWMDRKNVDSVLVTSSDGTFIGVFRPQDLDVPKVAGETHEA